MEKDLGLKSIEVRMGPFELKATKKRSNAKTQNGGELQLMTNILLLSKTSHGSLPIFHQVEKQ